MLATSDPTAEVQRRLDRAGPNLLEAGYRAGQFGLVEVRASLDPTGQAAIGAGARLLGCLHAHELSLADGVSLDRLEGADVGAIGREGRIFAWPELEAAAYTAFTQAPLPPDQS